MKKTVSHRRESRHGLARLSEARLLYAEETGRFVHLTTTAHLLAGACSTDAYFEELCAGGHSSTEQEDKTVVRRQTYIHQTYVSMRGGTRSMRAIKNTVSTSGKSSSKCTSDALVGARAGLVRAALMQKRVTTKSRTGSRLAPKRYCARKQRDGSGRMETR